MKEQWKPSFTFMAKKRISLISWSFKFFTPRTDTNNWPYSPWYLKISRSSFRISGHVIMKDQPLSIRFTSIAVLVCCGLSGAHRKIHELIFWDSGKYLPIFVVNTSTIRTCLAGETIKHGVEIKWKTVKANRDVHRSSFYPNYGTLKCPYERESLTHLTDHDPSGQLLVISVRDPYMTHGSLGPLPSFALYSTGRPEHAE